MTIKSHTVELNNFDEYERYLKNIFGEYKSLMSRTSSLKYHPPLFRGHRDAEWRLQTTLERTGATKMPFYDYVRQVEAARTRVGTFVGKHWAYKFSDLDFVRSVTMPIDLLPTTRLYPLYEYLVYLRHHTYPSPLLDWTVSPYVAAYFAFDFMGLEPPKNGKVAIYCYLETTDGTKSGEDRRGMIWPIGDNLNAHKRHFLQQCRYTVCLQKDEGPYVFGNHESAIDPTNTDQDVLIKIILPYSENSKVISRLRLLNIGPYQLFESEDSLIRGLAYESFVPGYTFADE